jgi:hypothetical protein
MSQKTKKMTQPQNADTLTTIQEVTKICDELRRHGIHPCGFNIESPWSYQPILNALKNKGKGNDEKG